MIEHSDDDSSDGRRDANDAHIQELRSLALPTPTDTFSRFRRRAAVVQGTRMLFESQVIGFWVVLDALLRLLLGARTTNGKSSAQTLFQAAARTPFSRTPFHGEQA